MFLYCLLAQTKFHKMEEMFNMLLCKNQLVFFNNASQDNRSETTVKITHQWQSFQIKLKESWITIIFIVNKQASKNTKILNQSNVYDYRHYYYHPCIHSLIAQLVKNPSAMQETPVRFLGWEDPLEKGQATHSNILGLPSQLSW